MTDITDAGLLQRKRHAPGPTLTRAPTGFFPGGHRRRKGSVVGGHHGECGARAYNGGLGAEPLVRGSGGRSPPEAESILVIGCPTEPANLAPVCENSMFCYGPLTRLRF